MPELSLLYSPAPYHILRYIPIAANVCVSWLADISEAMGLYSVPRFSKYSTSRYLDVRDFADMYSQSFVAGVVAYKALPRPQFATLQSAIFPIYFSIQTTLPVVLALTYPGERTAVGTGPASISGVLAENNRISVLIPILTMFATSLVNLLVVGPATTKIMKERKHQGMLLYLLHLQPQYQALSPAYSDSRWEE